MKLTNYAKSYLSGQPEDVQELVRRILDGLPEGVEGHASQDLDNMCVYDPRMEDWCVYLVARPRLKQVDVLVNASADEDGGVYLRKMRAFGVAAVEEKYASWGKEEGDRINVSISTSAPPEQFLALRTFLVWFLGEKKDTTRTYLVIATYDLTGAGSSAYPAVDAALEMAGLQKSAIHNDAKDDDAELPSNTFAAKIEGSSAAAIRDDVRSKMKAALENAGAKGRIFVAVGSNWSWGAGSVK